MPSTNTDKIMERLKDVEHYFCGCDCDEGECDSARCSCVLDSHRTDEDDDIVPSYDSNVSIVSFLRVARCLLIREI